MATKPNPDDFEPLVDEIGVTEDELDQVELPLGESFYDIPGEGTTEFLISADDFVAKNTSRSREAYIERIHYAKDAYPDFLDSIDPIDVWYDKGLYGKVDTHYNSVIPAEEWQVGPLITQVLKKLPGDDEQLFAMNFVVDAFVDLQKYMYVGANRGQIVTEGSVFMPFSAIKGWNSFSNRYRKYFEVLYEGFSSTFLNQKQNYKKVNNFTSFMKTFSHFLNRVLPNFPISASGYVLSNKYPLAATGLVIELGDADHGDDTIKYKEYIKDPNFLFFTGAARKFGFWVDKNAPWRLIADVGSATMQTYMDKYPQQPDDPGDPDPLEDLCSDLRGYFADYVGQKVSITSSNWSAQESSEGIITGLHCINAAFEPAGAGTLTQNFNDAMFEIKTYTPGSDIALLDSGLSDLSAMTKPQVSFPDEKEWGGFPAKRLCQELCHGSMTILGAKSPSGGHSVWLNTAFQGQSEPNGPGKPVGIVMDKGAGDGVHEYRWRIVDAPAGSTAALVDYNHPSIIMAGQLPQPNPSVPSNPVIISTTQGNGPIRTGIRFKPDVPGLYRLSWEAYNLDNPQVPRRIGNTPDDSRGDIAIRYCVFEASDISDAYVRDDQIKTRRQFYNLLRTTLAAIWAQRSALVDAEHARVSALGVDPTKTGGFNCFIEYDRISIKANDIPVWLFQFMSWLGSLHVNVQAHRTGLQAGPMVERPNLRLAGGSPYRRHWHLDVNREGKKGFGRALIEGHSESIGPNHAGYGYNYYAPNRLDSPPFASSWTVFTNAMVDAGLQNDDDFTYVLAMLSQHVQGGLNLVESTYINHDPCLLYKYELQPEEANSGFLGYDFRNPLAEPLAGYDYFEYWGTHAHRHLPATSFPLDFIQEFLTGNQWQVNGIHVHPVLMSHYALSKEDILNELIGIAEDNTLGPPAPSIDAVLEYVLGGFYDVCSDLDSDFEFDPDPFQNPDAPSYYIGKYIVPVAPQIATHQSRANVYLSGSTGWPTYDLARYDDSLVFTLKEKNNPEFSSKRSEYAKEAVQYPALKEVHDAKVLAKQAYDRKMGYWVSVHHRTNPGFGGPLTFHNLFKKQFKKTIDGDITQLKEYMLDFYNSYVLARPTYPVTTIKKGGIGTQTCLVKRTLITKESMESFFSESFWFEFYYYLRIQESGKKIHPKQLKVFQERSRSILSQLPADASDWAKSQVIQKILQLIHEETKGVWKEKKP